MKLFEVKTKSKNYPVIIFKKKFDKHVRKIISSSEKNLFIVIDRNVYSLHWERIKSAFPALTVIKGLKRITASEKNKSNSELQKIYSNMFRTNCDRDTILISIGGGITGDIAAYAASTFMRGIDYYHVPTTLLSMVDSSIGGKTGINFESRKNIIGSFYQPSGVLIDTTFLKTLPQEEINSGIGEVIKYSFLSGEVDSKHINSSIKKLYENDYLKIDLLIEKCAKLKASVVENDEREKSGVRKILNLGHTFGHAIESSLNFSVKHGEAVTFGIICSLFCSNEIKLISNKKLEQFLKVFECFKFNLNTEQIRADKIYSIMKSDKKNTDGNINLVLVKNYGEILIDVYVSEKKIKKSISRAMVWIKKVGLKKETVE